MAILAVNAVEPIAGHTGLAAATERLRQQDEQLVHGPGPNLFLPLGMAFSMFLMWSVSSAGHVPAPRRAQVMTAYRRSGLRPDMSPSSLAR